MNRTPYQSNGLPNNCDIFYLSQNAAYEHLIEILEYLSQIVFGMPIACIDIQNRKEKCVQHRLKMEEPTFTRHLYLHSIVKYSLLLFILAAMVALPSGICRSSTNPTAFEFSSIAPHHVSDFLDTSTYFSQAPASKQIIGAQRKESQTRADKPAPPFHDHIRTASQVYEVDIALIRAIIMAESSNNPRAVSHRGAQGLMQLMPTTAEWLGVKDALDPALNIDGGVRYLKKLLDRFDGDVKLALAAYNAGSRYVRKYGGVPPFKETRIYIRKVLKYRQQYSEEMAASQPSLSLS